MPIPLARLLRGRIHHQSLGGVGRLGGLAWGWGEVRCGGLGWAGPVGGVGWRGVGWGGSEAVSIVAVVVAVTY